MYVVQELILILALHHALNVRLDIMLLVGMRNVAYALLELIHLKVLEFALNVPKVKIQQPVLLHVVDLNL